VSEAPAAAADGVPAVATQTAGLVGGRRRLRRLVLLLLFYVAVGPPVGSVLFFAMIAITKIETPMDAAYALLAPFVGLLFSPFSYLVGALPAAFGGLFVASWQACIGRVSLIGIMVLGLILGLVSTYALGFGGAANGPADRVLLVVMLLTALLATVICWYPMRKRYFPPIGSSSSAGQVAT
jgi:hypothetical protein